MPQLDFYELWSSYKNDNSKEAKDKLIVEYVSLVKSIAGRLYSSYNAHVDYDDLVGYGIIGLIDAVEKFDHNKMIKFETYANIRIKGAIVDQIRQNDWIPRSARAKYKRIEEAMATLQAKYESNVTDQMMANEIGISLEDYHKQLGEVSTFCVISLEDRISENSSFDIPTSDDSVMPYISLEKLQTKNNLIKIISNLPEKERMVLEMYYYSDLTYKEIAAVLEVSESRISQIHTKAIAKLRASFSNME